MDYNESIAYLYGLQHHGIKLGLKNIERILYLLGNPERNFRSVHVAGTNGKGSVVSMVASLLREAGIRTGMFTSPHLVSFTERIQVDGVRISEESVIRLTEMIREKVREERDLNPTFFEFVTAMAFLYFSEMEVQWAIVETGLGGRFDSTNVLRPDVTVIMPVGRDHQEFLGNTLAEIASEKAGIIKEGIPLIVAPQKEEAMNVLMETAERKASPVYRYGIEFRSELKESTPEGVIFDYIETESGLKGHDTIKSVDRISNLSLPLAGEFQASNGAVAIKTSRLVLKSCGYLPERAPGIVRAGLARTDWPGRCELTTFRNLPILLDGAHNPDASLSLSKTLLDVYLSSTYSGLILIFGAMADKNLAEILRPLLPLAGKAIFTAPSYERSEKPERLLETARRLQKSIYSDTVFSAAPDLKTALELASCFYQAGDLIVVTGSLYTVGEARKAMGEQAVLADLREFR
jgi:dihydrofolate synthase/folylpolyglutamate synthase